MRLQEIDRAEITVLVDNYTDLLRSDSSPVVLRPPIPNGEVLLAEHGLSLFITAWSGEESVSVLMDAGASKIGLFYNAARLGISLHDIAAIVISHGHDDHVGSLVDVLERADRPVPVYLHPGSFSRRQKRFSNAPFIDIAPPDMNACRNAGAEVIFTPSPTLFWIVVRKETIRAITEGSSIMGNVLATARVVATFAVKDTARLIPMCHGIPFHGIDIEFEMTDEIITAWVRVISTGKTGVEMEALTGVSIALLTIWDMVKSAEKDENGQYPVTAILELKVEEKIKKGSSGTET